MKNKLFSVAPRPDYLAQNEVAVARLKQGYRLGKAICFTDPAPINRPVTATQYDMVEVASQQEMAPAIAKRLWRRTQILYAAKVQYQAVGLLTDVPHDTPLIFREPVALPGLQPEVPAGWTTWTAQQDHLDVQSLREFGEQLEALPGRMGHNKYAELLGKNNGQRMVDFLHDFVATKLQQLDS